MWGWLDHIPGLRRDVRGVVLLGSAVLATTMYSACGSTDERDFGSGVPDASAGTGGTGGGTGGASATGGGGGSSPGGAAGTGGGGGTAATGGTGATGGSAGAGTAGAPDDGGQDDGPVSNAN